MHFPVEKNLLDAADHCKNATPATQSRLSGELKRFAD